MAKPEIELRPGEQLLKDGPMNRVRSKMHIQGGSAFLTNHRFMRFQQSSSMQFLIGLLAFLFKDKPDFEVTLDQIRTIERTKQGLNKNALILRTADGEEYKLICTKFDEWMQAFQSAYDHMPTYNLFEIEKEKWAVQTA